jgi:hypothetical protein
MAGGVAFDEHGHGAADEVFGLDGVGEGHRHRAGGAGTEADVGEGDGHAAAALVNRLPAVDVDLAHVSSPCRLMVTACFVLRRLRRRRTWSRW